MPRINEAERKTQDCDLNLYTPAAYLAAHASYAKMLARNLRKSITARSGKGGQGATKVSAVS